MGNFHAGLLLFPEFPAMPVSGRELVVSVEPELATAIAGNCNLMHSREITANIFRTLVMTFGQDTKSQRFF